MLLRCRLTVLNIAVLKERAIQVDQSHDLSGVPPSAESRARGCERVWGQKLRAHESGVGSPLPPRDNDRAGQQTRVANLMLLHEIDPFGSELVTRVRDKSMTLKQLDVFARN